jgi:hypothetical protein
MVYDYGKIFEKEILDIKKEDMRVKFKEGVDSIEEV